MKANKETNGHPDRNQSARSTINLIKSIVSHSDHEALKEFHDFRTVFSTTEKPRLLFANYLSHLRDRALKTSWGIHCDGAYNLTVDKFSRIPKEEESGVDCRKYFLGVITTFEQSRTGQSLSDEFSLARILQRFVYRHFQLSLKECYRNGDMTRYAWRVKDGTIKIKMPRTIPGPARSRWLASHITDPAPNRPGEQHRVQTIIDDHFYSTSQASESVEKVSEQFWAPTDLPSTCLESLTTHGLASTIADEKADRIMDQRPAIQLLGQDGIKELIHHIFRALADGDYRDSQIAKKFNLSKSTFSRFAGSNWKGCVPDLFVNTAQLLMNDPAYREVVTAIGLEAKAEAMGTAQHSRSEL